MANGDRVRPILFGVAALALYVLTLAPGVSWGDSAQLQYLTESPRLSIGARGYPLWLGGSHLLYRVLPLTPAAAANLLSALCGAIAVTLAWHLARRLAGRRLGADVAAATLAVSHFFWSSSVVAEVYSLSAVFVLLLLMLAHRAAAGDRAWPAVTFGALTALCLLHHRSLLVVAFVLGIVLVAGWARRGRGLRPVLLAVLGCLAGSVPLVVLATMVDTSAGLDLTRILLGAFRIRPPAGPDIPGLLLYEAGFLALNFAGIQALLFLTGAVHAIRSRRDGEIALLAVFGVGILLPFLFAATGDRYIFLLPAFVTAAILAGLGAARLGDRWDRRRFAAALLVTVLAVPAAVYALLAHAVDFERFGLFRDVDPRHTTAFFWPGRSGDRHAATAGLRILNALPPDAVVLYRWGEGQVLVYLQVVEGRRPDVTLIPRKYATLGVPVATARREGRLFLSAYPFFPPPPSDLALGPPVIPGMLWPVTQP